MDTRKTLILLVNGVIHFMVSKHFVDYFKEENAKQQEVDETLARFEIGILILVNAVMLAGTLFILFVIV